MENKNKFVFLQSRKLAKITVYSLIIIFAIKTFLLSALFLIPSYTSAAENEPIASDVLVSLTNNERIKTNLKPLTLNSALQKAALNKVSDILKQNYFAHTNPDGKPFYVWIQEENYLYKSAGENLAISFSRNEDIMDAWMQSKTHRQNIIDNHYKEIGIAAATGLFNGKQTTVVVQLFGEPLADEIYSYNQNKLEAKILGINVQKENSETYIWLKRANMTASILLVVLSLMLSIIIYVRLNPISLNLINLRLQTILKLNFHPFRKLGEKHS